MRSKKGMSFEELGAIEFDKDDLIKERVLKNDFKKIYTLRDISKWVEYGFRNGMIKKGDKREDVEMVIKWIDLLGKGGKNFEI